MIDNTIRAYRAWETRKKAKEANKYERQNKIDIRQDICKVIRKYSRPNKPLNILTLETHKFSLPNLLKEHMFFISEKDEQEYKFMLKTKPLNVLLLNKGDICDLKTEEEMDVVYLDFCGGFNSEEGIIAKMLNKITKAQAVGFTFCLRKNDYNIFNFNNYQTELISKIQDLLKINCKLIYAKSYRDGTPMITLFFENKSKVKKLEKLKGGNTQPIMKQEKQDISIDKIEQVKNSRLRTDTGDLASLMEDIRHRGLLQPIGVFPKGNKFIIRFGNRRLEACKKLGWNTIPAIVTENVDEEKFMADNVAENYHKVDLTPLEIAKACGEYLNKGYSIAEISALMTIPKNKIRHSLDLIKRAPKEFHKAIAFSQGNSRKKGSISVSAANEIMGGTFINLKSEQKNELLNLVKAKKFGAAKIRAIKNLTADGMSFKKAIKVNEEYRTLNIEISVLTRELEKYKPLTGRKLIRAFVRGDLKPNKRLVL